MSAVVKSLDMGPIVGHAGHDHVRLWGRAPIEKDAAGKLVPASLVARVRRAGGQSWQVIPGPELKPHFDMTGVVVVAELQAGTRYEYQLGAVLGAPPTGPLSESFGGATWSRLKTGAFSTASTDVAAPRRIVAGSCRYLMRTMLGDLFDDRGDKTFASILDRTEKAEDLDQLLMIGDQIYADDLGLFADDKLEQYQRRYRDVFSQPAIRELMSRVRTYMILDDHEIEDNWPAKASSKDWQTKYPAAMQAYLSYQASHSPLFDRAGTKIEGVPDHLHYTYEDGCCEVFVLDVRTERTFATGDRRIISKTQMATLLQWLAVPSSRVKLVVSSVPFFPDMLSENGDKWSGFSAQRDEILYWIRSRRIPRVVFLSGDVHSTMSAELMYRSPMQTLSGSATQPTKIVSVVSSAFFWPWPTAAKSDFKLQGVLGTTAESSRWDLAGGLAVTQSDNFVRLGIHPDHIEVQAFGRKGDRLGAWSHRFFD